MGWSKKDLIKGAFRSIGLADYIYDLTPDQLQDAMMDMDAMMASWNGKGIRLGYPIPSTANRGNLDDDSCIPDWANQAVILNLGTLISSSVGKPVSPEHNKMAKLAYDAVMGRFCIPHRLHLPQTMPVGQGQKPWRGPTRTFIDDRDESIIPGPDSEFRLKK